MNQSANRHRSSRAPLLPGSGPLSKVSPVAVFIVVLALFGLGVWLRGPVGAGLLGLLVVLALTLLATTWRLLTVPERVSRVVVAGVLVLVAVSVLPSG